MSYEHLYQRMFKRYINMVKKNTLNTFLSDCYILPLIKPAIKILKKYLKKPETYLFSVGQSCSYFIFTVQAFADILNIQIDLNKLLMVAFSGRYYCNVCGFTGNKPDCTVSHVQGNFFFPSQTEIARYTEYLKEINLVTHKPQHYIILDLVCNGAGLLSFINLFKLIQGLDEDWTYETFIFSKTSKEVYNAMPMAKILHEHGSVFLDSTIYEQDKIFYDQLSANNKYATLRLVPEFYKKDWQEVNPLAFQPHENAQKMLLAIIDYVARHKEYLTQQIVKE